MQRTSYHDDDLLPMDMAARRHGSDANANDWDWGEEIQTRANSHERQSTPQTRTDSKQENHTVMSPSPKNSYEKSAQQKSAERQNPSWRSADDAVRVVLHIQRSAQENTSKTTGARARQFTRTLLNVNTCCAVVFMCAMYVCIYIYIHAYIHTCAREASADCKIIESFPTIFQ